MAFTIFMSHSSLDARWAQEIERLGEASGVTVYLFDHDPAAGMTVKDKLERAIRRSQAVVVLLTTHGIASTCVQQEIGIALAQKKLIIPLVEKGVGLDQLAMLQGVVYMEFDPEAPQQALADLTARLRGLADDDRRDQLILAFALIVIGVIALTQVAST